MNITREDRLKNIVEKYKASLLSVEGVIDVEGIPERLRTGEYYILPSGSKLRRAVPGSIVIYVDKDVREMEKALNREIEKILTEGYCIKIEGRDYGIILYPKIKT